MLTLLLLGLLIARVAVRFSVGVFVPILLLMLSVVFGSGLRRASRNVRDAAGRADAALHRAQRVLRRLEITSEAGAPVSERSRVRVDPDRGRRSRVVETTAETVEEPYEKAHTEARRRQR